MFKNKEKSVKFFVFILAVFFALFLAFNFYYKENLIIPTIGFFASFFILLMIEMYLRIQHNILKNVNGFKELVITLGQIEIDAKNKFESETDKLIKKISEENSKLQNEIIFNGQKQERTKEFFEKIISQDKELFLENLQKFEKIISQDKELFLENLEKQTNEIKRFYWTYVKEKRREILMTMCPDIFSFKSVLYIGAKHDRSDFLEDFQKSGYEITILEIYKPNVEYLKNIPWINEVVEADVCKFFTDKKFDVIFWWHGPEHVKKEEIELTLKKLEFLSNNLVILGCPWGIVPQDRNSNKNPFEEHISFFDTGYFENLGYKTDYFGKKDVMGSNILSLKRKNK